MLDIGFGEIVLIFGLALVVLGPEKLPRVASQVGRWIGRARGMARQFREQLEEEVNLEETRKSRPAVVNPLPPAATIEAPAATSVPENAPPHEVASTPAPAATHEGASGAAESSPYTGGSAESLAEPPQPVYPDHYSHAHPTDSEGRPLPPPTAAGTPSPVGTPSAAGTPSTEPPPDASGQQDWIGGAAVNAPGIPTAATHVPSADTAAATDKPAQSSPAPGYASPHERGT